jgi:hypothetical protein
MSKKEFKSGLYVRITEGEHNIFTKICKQMKTTKSAMIRALIENLIESKL